MLFFKIQNLLFCCFLNLFHAGKRFQAVFGLFQPDFFSSFLNPVSAKQCVHLLFQSLDLSLQLFHGRIFLIFIRTENRLVCLLKIGDLLFQRFLLLDDLFFPRDPLLGRAKPWLRRLFFYLIPCKNSTDPPCQLFFLRQQLIFTGCPGSFVRPAGESPPVCRLKIRHALLVKQNSLLCVCQCRDS